MRAVGRHRQIAALELVRSLGARLDPLQPMRDGKLDRLIITALEMQEFIVAIAAPVTAVNGIGAEKVECPADVVHAMSRHNEDDLFRHSLADQGEEATIEIGRTPLAV